MSPGISINKMVTKFASASFKPSQQTILPVSVVCPLLVDTLESWFRRLGGKLSHVLLDKYSIRTAGEAFKYSETQLYPVRGGDTNAAHFVWRSVRGVDDSPFIARDAAKILFDAKSF